MLLSGIWKRIINFAPCKLKTIQDMQNNSKAFVYFICSVSAMGGLLFGYDWVVIGGAKPFYKRLLVALTI